MLDIEVTAALAPKATIAVYFAPNTNQGFLDAITTAVHDSVNKPSVISISWGSAESTWTTQAMTQFDQAFQAAAAMGVTICVAAGDNGSSDSVSDGKPHVDFPASSPFALGCGGTKLTASGQTIASEVVWNENPTSSAGGGGVSGFFALPAYQAKAHVPPVAGRQQDGPRRAGRRRRCRSEQRLRRARRRPEPRDRRHQRGRAAVGRTDRAHEPEAGQAGRLPESAALRLARRQGPVQRHRQGQQRRLLRPAPAGTRARAGARRKAASCCRLSAGRRAGF